MWTVNAKFDDGTTERWEGLTQEQSRAVHTKMYQKGAWMIRSFNSELVAEEGGMK